MTKLFGNEIASLFFPNLPIPVSERLPDEGKTALFYFPGMMAIWSDDGLDPLIADPESLHSDMGQWQMLRVEEDGWLRCYGTQLKISDASHWLPLPPKPEKVCNEQS